MSPEEAARLADLLRQARERHGLTAREVARRAGVDVGTVTRIEQGLIPQPRVDSLRAIGAVLDIPTADLFAAIEWLPPKELPTFRPYLRAKYKNLPDEAVAELEATLARLADEYSPHGPRDGEDER
jgi:transcriptional regulator with XRE-family HTH domain